MTAGAHLMAAFLAAPPTPPPGKGAEWGKAAPIGLLVLVLLGVALYLLIKSMNRHMRKVSGLTSFDTTDGTTAGARPADGGPAGAAHSGSPTPVSDPEQRSPNDAPPVSTDPNS
ncbi:hypothetical protein ABLG96_16905 [Nakamurella sp. A5-74]|uniref:Uncharacterized protein n=1 Tax=Nakamurella sp. A5-74 TaxID=3158264 RepID=A0AAU8DKU5_9ACTN